jgi:hypothetical protein
VDIGGHHLQQKGHTRQLQSEQIDVMVRGGGYILGNPRPQLENGRDVDAVKMCRSVPPPVPREDPDTGLENIKGVHVQELFKQASQGILLVATWRHQLAPMLSSPAV